ncbi:phosphotransferase [Acerihabitans sp. TG2]|uniref:phosphotransferase n=1 Tax=Acerihabitans sp. TG2 TaxID=3096008 RepID=UPI002B23D217|nr:phosphotransferase [Acerihabitans sp. TG2]MEA9391999.1 phosphotransferase [Acerihabitans sp. TG2]
MLDELLSRMWPGVNRNQYHIEPVNGLTGESWRVRAPGNDCLARENTPQKRVLGVERQREYRILRQLLPSKLAPRPRGRWAQWLLVDWLAGENLSPALWQDELSGGGLARRLRQLHRRPLYGYPLNLRARYAVYWQASDPDRRCPAWLRLQQRFMRQKMPAALHIAPLHMDLHPGNVLRSVDGDLLLIDWEYAADGDIALELAALVRGNDLNACEQQALLRTYCASGAGYGAPVLQQRIAAWAPWVDYLMMMWYEARWGQTRQQQFVTAATPLRRRLGLPF